MTRMGPLRDRNMPRASKRSEAWMTRGRMGRPTQRAINTAPALYLPKFAELLRLSLEKSRTEPRPGISCPALVDVYVAKMRPDRTQRMSSVFHNRFPIAYFPLRTASKSADTRPNSSPHQRDEAAGSRAPPHVGPTANLGCNQVDCRRLAIRFILIFEPDSHSAVAHLW